MVCVTDAHTVPCALFGVATKFKSIFLTEELQTTHSSNAWSPSLMLTISISLLIPTVATAP